MWTESVLFQFGGRTNGGGPNGGLIGDAAGNLYGTTAIGGNGSCPNINEFCGIVYELSPTGGHWQESVLYNFTGINGDGSEPVAPVTPDAAGNLFGPPAYGGTAPCNAFPLVCGMVFELFRSNGSWDESILYSFTGQNGDGGNPIGAVVFDQSGNMYGTTAFGGGSSNDGTVFELSPANGSWSETVVHAFTGLGNDGAERAGGLLIGNRGNLRGTTQGGGHYGSGAVFGIHP